MFSADITPRVMFSIMISTKEEMKEDWWIEKSKDRPWYDLSLRTDFHYKIAEPQCR
jgi:hypothetical protein